MKDVMHRIINIFSRIVIRIVLILSILVGFIPDQPRIVQADEVKYSDVDTLRFPLDGKWSVGIGFGEYNPDQRYVGRRHLGEDYIASAETPVYAVANGLVKHNGSHTGYMNVIIIEHRLSDGTLLTSVSAHMKLGGIAEGAEVQKGELIGTLDTEASFAANDYVPHLHFGLRKGAYIPTFVYYGYETGSETISNWYWPTTFINNHLNPVVDPPIPPFVEVCDNPLGQVKGPLEVPTPFLYLPYQAEYFDLFRWNSQMDHTSPTYQKDGYVSTLGEKLSYDEHHPKSEADTQAPLQGGTWSFFDGSSDFYPWNVKPPLSKGFINYYQSPTLANVYEYYDSIKSYIGYDGHDGHDFGVVGNALSAAAGKVIYARDSGNSLGRVVMIHHPQGYVTSYAHLASFNVTEGQEISMPGQVIGVIGGSGRKPGGPLVDNFWGIHLHFTVYRWNEEDTKWRVTDPFGWDPWLEEQAQINDPLKLCNGEVSYNLWAGGSTNPVPYFKIPNSSGVIINDVNAIEHPANDYYLGGSLDEWLIDVGQTNDQLLFVADVTIPDGMVVSPGQSLTKIWRMKNTGSTTWSAGYKLIFVSGNQMGAPSETSIPSTAPNQTVDLSVPITAPAAAGEHTGYFQLRNPQGTYFGPQIWVKINVRSASNKITILTADPPSPADTSTVRIRVKVEGIPNLRAIRLKVDGVVQGEFGGPEHIFTWDTQGFSPGDHNIVIEAADQTDTSWSNPEIRSMNYTLYGSAASPNLKPDAPSLVSPYDWYVYYSGDTAQLCAQENGDPNGDGISAYYFEIYESPQSWNSGWTGSNCVNTTALGPYNYKWHVKVSDTRGAESDWSPDRNFTLVNPNLSITELYFEPQDANSEVVKIRACTAGLGGLGITMRVDVNDANDGSANGQWYRIKELGVPCFNDIDAPIWQTLDAGGNFGDGWHLVRVEAHSANTGWDGAAVREATYYLPHRRPSRFPLVAPVSSDGNYNTPVFLNSPTVAFQWGGALRANTYTLSIGFEQNPADSSNPLYRQTFNSGVTQQTVTLADNYPTIYWQVRATNDKGYIDSESQRIGIDQTLPGCWIHSLPEVSYENNVQVNWEGDDTPAGIFSYDIQYLDSNRGVWSDWLTAVPANKTYELFSGQAGHSYSFRCRATDYAGNVGSFETSGVGTIKIDPAARPVEVWWREWYETKRSVTIQNNMPSADLPAFYPVQVRLTSGTSPSAADIYNASTAAIKCDDLRIVFNNDTEIPRFIKRCSPDEIEIWFRTETIVPAGSTSAAYQIYVGNPAASNPPGNPTLVWYPYPEGDTTNLYLFQEGSGSTALDYSGNGRDCTINPSVGWSTGKWGSGLNFQQANNGNTVSLTCGSPYPIYSLTAEMWFKSDSSFYNSDGRLAGQLGPNNQLSWLFSVEGSKLKFERWCNGGSQQARGNIDLHREPYLSQWNHIAITFDGGNQVNFYVNGVLDNAVTLYDSCNETHNIPLEIGSVEGFGQGYYTLGAFKLSNTVKTNFYPGTFANITNEPSTAVGLLILPPATGVADLAVESLATFPLLTGGILVEAGVRNVGSVSTINGFYTDLYLNHVPIGGDDFVGSVNFWVNDPIPAGGTTTLSTVITDLGQLGLNASMPGEEQTGILYAQTDSTSALTEPDKQNNIFSNGVEVCVATADAYESNDNSPAEAGWIEDTQLHNFDRPEDEDWLKLDMIKGQFYSISTSDLGLTADTYLYLYDQDGMTLLAYNDDIPGSLSSEIEWIAPVDGTYYILVKQWNQSVWGCGTSWSITVQNLTTPDLIYRTYLPLTSNYNPNQITVYGMAEDVETGMIGCSWSDCFTSSMADFIYQGYPVGTVAGSKNDNETYT